MKFEQQWTACGKTENTSEYGKEFPASVPGNVQYDYAVANGISDYFYGVNADKFDVVEDYIWKYKTQLSFDAKEDDRIFFVAEGIDYIFDVLLDGRKIYSSEGMYSVTELDITDKAVCGSLLEVVIHPHPKRAGAEFRSRREADNCCKPPVSYGWDWCPRILPSGMWQPAYIETRAKNHIYSCEPFYTLNSERTTAKLRFETVCDTDVLYSLYDPNGNLVYSGTQNEITVDNVALWWCNGQGNPSLYSWTAKTDTCEKSGKIGFRTVRLVHNAYADVVPDFPKGRYPCPITVELNGRRIFAKGSNFVNPEVFFGRITDERYREQVLLAQKANMNIFRCWGGAGIHKSAFYEYCDEYGIMVWQEFMLACNNYLGDEHYLAVLEREATSVVKQLRSHACIVLWCGGNELFNDWSGMDNQSLALRLLDKVCYENDKARPYIMTAPEFGMAHGGYTFVDEKLNKDVFRLYADSLNTAYSEFGVPSITNEEDLRKIIPEDELFPIKPTDSWIIHHGFSAWFENCWVCDDILNRYFPADETLDKRIYHSNWLQSVGYKAIFEEARRQWGYCSMAINWCFNEPWITAAGNSLLTYPSKPKPAYYAVRDSLKNAVITARIPRFDWKGGEIFSAELWYLNDNPFSVCDSIDVEITVGDTHLSLLHWDTGEVSANDNKLGPTVHFKLPEDALSEEIVLTLKSENGGENEYKLFYRTPETKAKTLTMNI